MAAMDEAYLLCFIVRLGDEPANKRLAKHKLHAKARDADGDP